MFRIPFVSRRVSGGQDSPDARPDKRDTPWWVPLFTDWGRPAAALVVLVLCAPGEQHLAYLAGWNGSITWLSWGWAGLLSLYAGISAVVATVRPRGSRGKATAVAGASLSLLLAMAAQPVAHMFTTGWLSAEPRPPLWLVVIVSGIPPFILGHLLHLAATPSGQSARTDKAVRQAVRPPADTGAAVRPATEADKDVFRRTVSEVSGVPLDMLRPAAGPVRPRPAPVSAAVPTGQKLAEKQSLSARALVLAQDGLDKEAIKDTLRIEFPDAKADSVRKAADRATDKLSAAS